MLPKNLGNYMSKDPEPNVEAPKKRPQVEAPKSDPPKPKGKPKRECPSENSSDGKHDFFFNEGTEETYCRYCGKSK